MGLYTEPSMELLCQQVVRDNPELAGRITADSIGVRGLPIAKAAKGRNTQITLVGKPGKGFAGELLVYYDRLALTVLFRAPITLYVPKSATKVQDLLPYIREVYGLQLEPSDIVNATAALSPLATLTNLTLTVSASCPCYTGTFTVSYAAQPYGYYPKSGPGSKQLLAGNELYGYFGKVSQAEFATSAELWLTAFPGMANGTIPQTGYVWHKFFMNGTVVYLPDRGVGLTSWASLYAAGAVYGDGTTGTPPPGPDPTTQTLYYSKTENGETSFFSLRIPVDGSRDPNTGFGLMAKLGDGTTGGEWGNDTTIQFGDQVILNTLNASKNLVGNMKGTGGAWIDSWTNSQWWPIVEMLDKSSMVVPLADIEGVLTWTCRPVVFDTASSTDGLFPIAIEAGTTPLPKPMPGVADTTTILVFPIGIESPTVAVPLPMIAESDQIGHAAPIALMSPHVDKPRPLVATSGNELIKMNIATTDGELDGFR
ncbi:putative virion structural protein [Erwinia phage pEa_SNUABM_8]|nr:putative virion structural protein [Erwinia phage pEa_SNUABM_8]QVW54923.1 hypothetical protein pEaSNUABM4_00170 [Erwinia phage pEa_SNUABM_4]